MVRFGCNPIQQPLCPGLLSACTKKGPSTCKHVSSRASYISISFYATFYVEIKKQCWIYIFCTLIVKNACHLQLSEEEDWSKEIEEWYYFKLSYIWSKSPSNHRPFFSLFPNFVKDFSFVVHIIENIKLLNSYFRWCNHYAHCALSKFILIQS